MTKLTLQLAPGYDVRCRHKEDTSQMLKPRIGGEWWNIASDPDLGELTNPKQQPVDFAVWQAADGTWQLWSCIRGTNAEGNSRLFYRWEGQNLRDPNWRPMGIAMEADPSCGETPGGLQAPYVLSHKGTYLMFYGDWENICLATSVDGRSFQRRLLPSGKCGMFSEGTGWNTRDPMTIRIDNTWYCYYTAFPQNQGAVYCRTSEDLINWSDSKMVAFGGSAGTGPYSSECPFVVQHESGSYYLFRTQRYGEDAQTSIYISDDPLYFGIDDGRLVCRLPIAAPEIVRHDDRYFIACLLPDLKGIRMAELDWVSI